MMPDTCLKSPEKNIQNIRPLTTEDYQGWCELINSVWPGLPSTLEHDFIAIIKETNVSPEILIQEKLVGASLNIVKINPENQLSLLVHMLGVDPDHQGQGIGQQLMQENFQIARESNLPKIQLTSDPLETNNVSLYLHHSRMHSNTYVPDLYTQLNQSGGEQHRGLSADRLLYQANPNSPWILQGELPSTEEYTQLIQQDSHSSKIVLVEIPANIVKLKEEDINQAQTWRQSHAQTLPQLFDQGYTAVDRAKINSSPESTNHYIVCINNFDENNPDCLQDAISSSLN